jgi:FkbM family methyltransferase
MKQAFGIWLPDGDQHFEGMMAKAPRQKLPDGREVGVYQWQKLQAALLCCPPKRRRVALDVGAHVGLWSMWLALAFERLYAFEPVAEHAECWRANMEGFDRAHLFECALGAMGGNASMERDRENTGKAHVAGVAMGPTATKVRTIDALLLDRVDLVKIDVEGFETAVIHGGRETLLRDRPVVVVESNGQHERYNLIEPVGLLQQMGAKVLHRMRHDVILGWSE